MLYNFSVPTIQIQSVSNRQSFERNLRVRMKEAKGGLAEFLDDTIQLSTIVLLILLEADTKFERFSGHCPAVS